MVRFFTLEERPARPVHALAVRTTFQMTHNYLSFLVSFLVLICHLIAFSHTQPGCSFLQVSHGHFIFDIPHTSYIANGSRPFDGAEAGPGVGAVWPPPILPTKY